MVRTAVLLVGAFYVVGIGVMFVFGLGIPAAYLTFPGWYVVSMPANMALSERWFAVVATWAGNLVMLMLAAMINVAIAYGLARVLFGTTTLSGES